LALARHTRDRYPEVGAFVRMFEAGLEGEDIAPPPRHTEVFEREEPPARRTGILRIRPRRDDRPAPKADGWERYDDVPEVEPIRPSRARRWYRRGGKLARRSGGVRRTLWKLTLLLLIANLMLGSILMVRDGPAALVERFLSVAPGTTTEVSGESLSLRAAPGSGAPLLAVLQIGQEVRVTGFSESDEQGRWWPVEVDVDGQTIEGWV